MGRTLWIEGYDYAVRLLRQGEDPWNRPQDLGMFVADTAGLLKPDRLFLPLAPLIAKHLAGHLQSAEAFDGVIADGKMLETLRIGLASLSAMGAMSYVVPMLPGPAMIAGDNAGPDDMDLTVTGMGDILRCVGQAQAKTLALNEDRPEHLQFSDPLFRVAEHLGCEVVLARCVHEVPSVRAFPSQGVAGSCMTVDLTPDAKGDGPAIPVAVRDVKVVIAPDAAPEDVLRQLAAMRQGTA